MKLVVKHLFLLKSLFRTSILMLCCYVAPVPLLGQEADTVLLNNVNVSAKAISEFGIGARVTQLDTTTTLFDQGGSLANVINEQTPVYIKSYGSGMLSTISFRGSGASHTSVLWNGVNIGYPMLGQSDLSALPMFFDQEVALQHGSGSSLYGSGAVGGMINITTKATENGLGLSLTQEAGSFNTFFTGGSISYGVGNSYFRAQGFTKSSENDFLFENTTKVGSPAERQNHAAYNGSGASADVRIGLSEKATLSLATQIVKLDRELQPSMNDQIGGDNQQDENFRGVINYLQSFKKISVEAKYAHLYDLIDFNGSSTKANQDILDLHLTGNAAAQISYKFGGSYNWIAINSPFFADENASEQRSSLYGAIKYTPGKWQMSANLRQTFVTGYVAPFTPSVGLEYQLINSSQQLLFIKAQAASGYRVPTLNDRYWDPGGNVDLLPESSVSAEVGVTGRTGEKEWLTYEVTYYQLWVDDWIIWLPEGNYWSPQNIKQVNGKGVELSAAFNHHLGRAALSWRTNYAFTSSVNQKGIDQFDRSVGKQLPYAPLHNANFSGTLTSENWTIVLIADLTGKRFVTADNESDLPAFTLLNTNVAKTFRLKKSAINVYLKLNNILNTTYQNIKNKAMPGFNGTLGVKLYYNNL